MATHFFWQAILELLIEGQNVTSSQALRKRLKCLICESLNNNLPLVIELEVGTIFWQAILEGQDVTCLEEKIELSNMQIIEIQ